MTLTKTLIKEVLKVLIIQALCIGFVYYLTSIGNISIIVGSLLGVMIVIINHTKVNQMEKNKTTLFTEHLHEFDEIKKLWNDKQFNPIGERFFSLGEFKSLSPLRQYEVHINVMVDIHKYEIEKISEYLGLHFKKVEYNKSKQTLTLILHG